MTADSTGARFSAAGVPTWHFSCDAWLSCQLQQGTDGGHGPGEAVGAVGATFHVETCAHWNGVGARATWAPWKARPGHMTSELHRMDMSYPGATHDHLGTPSSPRRLPPGVSFPSLPCSRDSHALRRFQPALRPCAAIQCGLPSTALACACHVAHVLPLHVHNVLPCSC